MKKIRILSVLFDTELKPYEVVAFRGAMVEKVGREETLFHNHLGEGFRYRYPLIQYKAIGGKPAVICIEEGVDHIHKYFEKSDWSIMIGDRRLHMKIESLNLNQFTMQAWEHKFDYRISNWLALNQTNIKKYNEIDSLAERITFLEGLLKANILSFAKGISWHIDRTIEVSIKQLDEPKAITFKFQKLLAFNAQFSTNVFIPNHIGLGKGVSVGFGVVKESKKNP
jgi:hypothetical protein